MLIMNNESCNSTSYFKITSYLVLSIVIMELLKLNLDSAIKISHMWKKTSINLNGSLWDLLIIVLCQIHY